MNTSHNPLGSSLIVIYRDPSPVRIRRVTPFVATGRTLGVGDTFDFESMLRIYSGPTHPHFAQNPKEIKL